MENIKWYCKQFTELKVVELYEIMKLRSEVFVVEQNCPYLDCDGKDFKAHHVFGFDAQGVLVAYTRLFDKSVSYPDFACIGRVVCANEVRNTGIGKQLMLKSIDEIYRLYGRQAIKIGVQLYLKGFYENLGFVQSSPIYLEDGIEHIEMILP